MPNDLATLNGYLDTQLRDTTDTTWSSAEKNNLLTWSTARLYPRVARRVLEYITLTDDTDQYETTDLIDIDRVDLLDGITDTDELIAVLRGGVWEFWGDGETVGGILFLNRRFAITGKSLRVQGWSSYDLVANPPPDKYVPLILALARAEACRREIARRTQSENWRTLDQTQNISVNELVLMVNEADSEAANLWRQNRVWRRPKPAG